MRFGLWLAMYGSLEVTHLLTGLLICTGITLTSITFEPFCLCLFVRAHPISVFCKSSSHLCFCESTSHFCIFLFYRLCIVFLTFSCIGYAMPFILCATICCCLPCIISVLGFREDLSQTRGATSESIDALPTYKFKLKKSRSGNDRESNSGVSEGGVVAAGTEKERVISGEDAVSLSNFFLGLHCEPPVFLCFSYNITTHLIIVRRLFLFLLNESGTIIAIPVNILVKISNAFHIVIHIMRFRSNEVKGSCQ